jgi:hypothetical protein
MTHASHEEMRDALAAEAAGALDADGRAALRAHLRECAACRAELDELREAAALMAHAPPAAAMDASAAGRMRARLVARAAADRAAVPSPSPAFAARAAIDRPDVDSAARARRTEPGVIPLHRARSGGSRMGWLAAAAAVLLLIGAGMYARGLRARIAELDGRTASLQGERERLRARLAERDQTLSALSGPAVQVVTLAGGRQAPSGRMFWDPPTDRWTFFAHRLPAVRAGREYQLWLITPGRKIPAGTFRPTPGGDAVVQATYRLSPDSLRAIAVTEEPAGGLPAPSGPIVLAGASAR